MNEYSDRKSNLYGACDFCCESCCIHMHEKGVRNSGWVKSDNLFYYNDCMTGKVEYD